MYSSVVVPLDGSRLAEGVLPHVVEVTRGRGSRIHLLSVVASARGGSGEVNDSVANGRARPNGEMAAYLQGIAAQLEPATAEVQVEIRSGRQADEILSFAAEVDADLIAMSTHGRSGIGRWVFGSVADRILRRSRCPVLLVRAGHTPRQAHYQRILVPLDGSELAEQVLPYIKALVTQGTPRSETTVYLVSVLTTGLGDRTMALLTSYPPGLQLATPALQYAQAQLLSYLRSVAAVLRDQGAVVRVDVLQGSPAEEVIAYAAEKEVDLIGMTTHGFSGLSRWVYGNVAAKVLQGGSRPVLLVRPVTEETAP